MKIEAVTVCIGYGDFLVETLKYNLPLFDRWIIITSPEDKATQTLCRQYHLQCIISEEHTKNDDTFNKGRLIERGLQHVSMEGWRLHIDADIALPNYFRRYLEQAHLQENYIYGADRIMVKNWEDWQRFQNLNYLYGNRAAPYCINVPQTFSIGARWSNPEAGWVPIGFFQMWHSDNDFDRGVRIKPYPLHHNSSCRTDVQFSLHWDRRHRAIIPEFFTVHLESEPSTNGMNWSGRKSKPFGPRGKNYMIPDPNNKNVVTSPGTSVPIKSPTNNVSNTNNDINPDDGSNPVSNVVLS